MATYVMHVLIVISIVCEQQIPLMRVILVVVQAGCCIDFAHDIVLCRHE